MLIEYKVKFEKDGLTITQRVEPGGGGVQAKPDAPVVQNTLPASVVNLGTVPSVSSVSGGGPFGRDEGGGPFGRDEGGAPGLGSGPITIIGPIVFTCPHNGHSHDTGKSEEK